MDSKLKLSLLPTVCTLGLSLCSPSAAAQTQSADTRPAETKPANEITQTFFLANATDQHELNDIQTDLRNVLNRAHIYSVSTQNAITVHGTPDDIALTQKLITELDRPHKVYRLTYSISEIEGGKRTGTQHVSLIVLTGTKTTLRQGSRIPILTGSLSADSNTPSTQVQYVDVGLNIDATVEGSSESLRLQTKVEQSSLAEERSGIGAQDPIIRQTTLQGDTLISQGKPLLLGSLDIPGGMRQQEIEVVSELVH
jgi:type II secretory pathway component GspD/PulD (secretin)